MITSLLEFLRRLRYNLRYYKIKSYIRKGHSHLFSQFILILSSPVSNKIYLTIGDNTILDCRVIFETNEGEVAIGDNVFIGASQLICRSKIVIENYVFIAWGCFIYDHDSHSINYKERETDIKQQLTDYRNGDYFIKNKNWSVVNSQPIRICSNAWIGMNSIILKGVVIGEGAIVGAGSVVTKDVMPWTIVGGNPAQLLREIPKELRKG